MKHHIVAIGLSKHQNRFVPNLQFASRDAREFYELFEANIGNIGYKKLLVDSEATLAQIQAALGQELQITVSEDDVLFFFYSGHGTTAETPDGTALAHYLMPFDATPDIPHTCISVEYLRTALEQIPCRVKLVFVDSCFSGSINSKGYTNPSTKALKEVKTFGNTVLGTGSVSFTACKDIEEAIEDSERKYGLFTSELIAELCRKRTNDRFSVADIFTPVTERVIKRAKERYQHIQTPTVNTHLEGVVYLPVFKLPKSISPQIIQPPRHPELAAVTVPVPHIALDDKALEELINNTAHLIISSGQSTSLVDEIAFERFCGRLIKGLKEEWEKVFTKTGGDVSAIPVAVSELESAAFQLILLGAVIAVFGNQRQMEIYAEHTSEIFEFEKGRAGLVALLAVPEIVLVDIIYLVGVASLARGTVRPLTWYMKTPVFIREDQPPQPLFMARHIHYCDALGGYATKVNDHVRELLQSYTWIPELAPRAEGRVLDLQLQVNFLLSLLLVHHGDRLWTDFGRFYGHQLRKPLLQKLLYDEQFVGGVAELFALKPSDLLPRLRELLDYIRREWSRGSGYHWDSIDPEDLMRPEDRRPKGS